ncbi:MAG TPA: hypothetical protein VIR33_12530 [Thermopolyspora sp.]
MRRAGEATRRPATDPRGRPPATFRPALTLITLNLWTPVCLVLAFWAYRRDGRRPS